MNTHYVYNTFRKRAAQKKASLATTVLGLSAVPALTSGALAAGTSALNSDVGLFDTLVTNPLAATTGATIGGLGGGLVGTGIGGTGGALVGAGHGLAKGKGFTGRLARALAEMLTGAAAGGIGGGAVGSTLGGSLGGLLAYNKVRSSQKHNKKVKDLKEAINIANKSKVSPEALNNVLDKINK